MSVRLKASCFISLLLLLSFVAQAQGEQETKEEKQTRKRIELHNRHEPKTGFPPKVGEKGDQEDSRWRFYGSVSLIRLIAQPEKYHKKFVATEGYLRWSRNPYLFLNEIEGKQFLFRNSLTVRLKEGVKIQGVAKKVEDLNGQYIYAEGIFDQWDKDPNVCPNGTITISRIIQR